MRKLIGLFVVLLMMGMVITVVSGEEESTASTKLEELHNDLKNNYKDIIPKVVIDRLTAKRLTWFEIKTDNGITTITYLGELGEDGKVKEGNEGIEIFTKKDNDGNPTSKFPMLKKSKLSYKNKELVSAEILAPITCSTDGSGACPLDPIKGEGYELGNRVYPVAPGSTIKYDVITQGEKTKQEVVITSPNGELIYPSKKIDGEKDDEEIFITYTTEGDSLKVSRKGEGKPAVFSRLELDGDKKGPIELNYDTEKARFYVAKPVAYKNSQIGAVRNADETYLFVGENVPNDFEKPAVAVGGDFNTKINGKDRKVDASAILMHVPAGSHGFAVRLRSGENVPDAIAGDISLKGNKEFVVYAVGDGTVFGKEGEGSNEVSRVVVRSGQKIEGRSTIPVIDAEGGFHLINSNGLYHANDKTNGIRQSHIPIKKDDEGQIVPFKIMIDGQELTAHYETYEPVPVQILAGDNKYYQGLADSKLSRNAEFGVFIDKNHKVLVATNENEKLIFSDSAYHNLPLKDRNIIIDYVAKGGDIKKIYKVIAGENRILDLEPPKQPPTVDTSKPITLKDIHDYWNGKNGISLVSNVRSDGRYVVKVGFKGCGPCDKIANDMKKRIKKIEGPVINVDSRLNPDVVKTYNIKDVPALLYFDKNGKFLKKDDGWNSRTGFSADNIINFFK